MTDKTLADFDEFVQPQTDTNGNYVGDHYALWQAATIAERERCAAIYAAAHHNPDQELIDAIRSGK